VVYKDKQTAHGHNTHTMKNYKNTLQDLATTLQTEAVANGGATIALNERGEMSTPSTGFCVGYGGAQPFTICDTLTETLCIVLGFELQLGRTTFGSWIDTNTGALYVEAVTIFEDRAAAIKAAQVRNELAIYDLATGTEIRTPKK